MARLLIADGFKGSFVYSKKGARLVRLELDRATQAQLKELQALGHPAIIEAKEVKKKEPEPETETDE